MPRTLPKLSAVVLTFIAGMNCPLETSARDLTEADAKSQKTPGESITSEKAALRDSKSLKSQPGRAKVLFITAKGCKRCEEELNRLRKPGGDFETMKSIGWRIGESENSHIQIIDRDELPKEMLDLLKIREFPTVACVVDDEIVRSFKDGCTTPLDAWTFGWLIKGKSERPQPMIPEAIRVESTGHYRLRGNHWTVDGDPSPAKQVVVSHIRGPNHAHAIASYGNIEAWSYEELRSLHDDLHEMEGGTVGNVAPSYGPQYHPPANQSLDAFAGNRKALGR